MERTYLGAFEITPRLNAVETNYLTRFAQTRRMLRLEGPYFADPAPDGFGQDLDSPNVVDFNAPQVGQPSLWCQWLPTPDGRYLVWDGGEAFDRPVSWLRYLIAHFLADGIAGRVTPTGFERFTFDHHLTGRVTVMEGSRRARCIVASGTTVQVMSPDVAADLVSLR